MVRPTIPFASATLSENGDILGNASSLSIELSFPDDISECNLGKAHCAIDIESFTYKERHMYDNPNNWRKTYSIKVFNTDPEYYYIPNHKLLLRLKTNDVNGQGGKIFAEATFPDVHVSNRLL